MTKEETKNYDKEYYEEHKASILAKQKEYYQQHKEHRKEINRKYVMEHQEQIRAYKKKLAEEHKSEEYKTKRNSKNREKYQENLEENRKKGREYYESHKEAYRVSNEKYKSTHKEQLKESGSKYGKEYWALHREELIEKHKKYMQDNKEVLNVQANEHKKLKRQNDPLYKISCYMRSRLSASLSGAKEHKHTEEIIGCSFSECRDYIATLFTEGMSWGNYGINGWHVDHILPTYYFDLTNDIHQKVGYNYRNLQPLWEKDNLQKNKFLQPGWQFKLYEICFALGIGPKQVFEGSRFPVGEEE